MGKRCAALCLHSRTLSLHERHPLGQIIGGLNSFRFLTFQLCQSLTGLGQLLGKDLDLRLLCSQTLLVCRLSCQKSIQLPLSGCIGVLHGLQ